eukprot:scaffold263912_cov21-Tisochrysis_lutea.AAC.1
MDDPHFTDDTTKPSGFVEVVAARYIRRSALPAQFLHHPQFLCGALVPRPQVMYQLLWRSLLEPRASSAAEELSAIQEYGLRVASVGWHGLVGISRVRAPGWRHLGSVGRLRSADLHP